MSNKASTFTKLPAPPDINTIRPRYCSFSGNGIIVNDGRNLEMYDLDKQMITKKWEPTNNIGYYKSKASCIDSKRSIHYIVIGDLDFFGLLDDTQLIAVDLIKNEWNVLESNNITESQSIFFIPSINKLLYINKPNQFSKGNQYFYRNSTDQLFKKRDKELMVCDVCANGKWMSDWKIYEKILPNFSRLGANFEMILAFDQVIFYFDYSRSWDHGQICNHWTIWCLDLDHKERWYQARHKMPDFGNVDIVPYAIKDDDNNVHLINFGKLEKNRYHFRASLSNLVPAEIIELNRPRTELLIIGFVKEFEKRHKTVLVPMYLKKIIVKFYPIFV